MSPGLERRPVRRGAFAMRASAEDFLFSHEPNRDTIASLGCKEPEGGVCLDGIRRRLVALVTLAAVGGGLLWLNFGQLPGRPAGTVGQTADDLGVQWRTGNNQTGGGSSTDTQGSGGLGVEWSTNNNQPQGQGGNGGTQNNGGLGVEWSTNNSLPQGQGGNNGLNLNWSTDLEKFSEVVKEAYRRAFGGGINHGEAYREAQRLNVQTTIRTVDQMVEYLRPRIKQDAMLREEIVKRAYSYVRRVAPTPAQIKQWDQVLLERGILYEDLARLIDYQPGECSSPLLAQAIRDVTGREPQGSGDKGECDFGRYSGYALTNDLTYITLRVAERFGKYGICADPMLTEVYKEVVGYPPQGYKNLGHCDPAPLGPWTDRADLEVRVAKRFERWGVCKELAISNAYHEVFGRRPEGFGQKLECDPARYSPGPWRDYEHLKARTLIKLGKNPLTAAQVTATYRTAYGREPGAAELQFWLRPASAFSTPGDIEDAGTLQAALKRGLAQNPGERQAVVERALASLFKWDSAPASVVQKWRTAQLNGGPVLYEELRRHLAAEMVDIAYRQLLKREPDPQGRQHYIDLLLGPNYTGELVWKELARSQERLDRFGYWAPHVTGFDGKRELCFGAVGPGCQGVPWLNEPRWVDKFTRPDGVEMGYIEIYVAVGSILHDNSCLRYGGHYCSGIPAGVTGDLIPLAQYAQGSSLEWNKAVYNMKDGRVWRHKFGPYPLDDRLRGLYSDDLTKVANRSSKMAPVIHIGVLGIFIGRVSFATPYPSVPYVHGETRQTRALVAPAGVPVDRGDQEFCASGRYTEGVDGLQEWGSCQ